LGIALVAGTCDPSLVDAALDVLVEAGDPNAASMRCAWESQAVNLQVLFALPGDNLGGAADSNTIAVSREIVKRRDIETLAMLLAHEWHHVKQAGDSPETPGEGAWPAPCREYAAYRAQYLFMCSLMSLRKAQNDDGVLVQRPFPCSALRYSELLSRWHDCVNDNMGGSPAIPPVPAGCGSLYCEK